MDELLAALAPFWQWIFVPAVVAGAVWGAGWKIWDRKAAALRDGTWVGPLAFAAAFAAGFILLEGWPGFPPRSAEGWLPYIGAGAGLLSAGRFGRRELVIQIILWGVIFAFAVMRLTVNLRPTWSGGEEALWFFGFVVTGLAAQMALEVVAERRPGVSMPVVYWILAVGVFTTLALSGSITYAQYAGIVAAAAGAAFVAACIKPSISFSGAGGTSGVVVVLLNALLLCGNLFSGLPLSVALILAGAPIFLLIGEMGWVTQRAGWQQVLLRAVFVGVPVGVAVGVAKWMSPRIEVF